MNFILHKDFSEINSTEWNNLLAESINNVPFLRYEYLNTWWATRGGGEWPQAELLLLSAREGDHLLGIAPLFLAEYEGHQTILLLGSIEISDYLDVIVRADDLSRFLTELLDTLESLPYPDPGRADSALTWSCIDWYNLPETSPTLAALKAESVKRGWAHKEEVYKPTPSIPLTGDFETYLANIDKKQRHEIRRKMRRAEADEREVRWYIVTDESTLDSEIDALLALMANDHHKEEFLTEVMRTQMRNSFHAAFKAGWLQLAFMDVDGKKAAGYLNFDYGDRIWVYNSGLDFDFRDLSPGWVLLGHLLRWANENGKREFDFMRGDEDYKYKFGGEDRHVMRVKVER